MAARSCASQGFPDQWLAYSVGRRRRGRRRRGEATRAGSEPCACAAWFPGEPCTSASTTVLPASNAMGATPSTFLFRHSLHDALKHWTARTTPHVEPVSQPSSEARAVTKPALPLPARCGSYLREFGGALPTASGFRRAHRPRAHGPAAHFPDTATDARILPPAAPAESLD